MAKQQKYPATTTYFDPAAREATQEAALAAAGGDKGRLITVSPYTVVVVNFPGFPVESWTRKEWRR